MTVAVFTLSQFCTPVPYAQKVAAIGERFHAETNDGFFDGSVRVRASNDNCDLIVKIRIYHQGTEVRNEELLCGDRMDQTVQKADRVEIEPATKPYRVEFIKNEIGDALSREFYSTHQETGCSLTSIVDNRDADISNPPVTIFTGGVIHTALPRARENVYTPFNGTAPAEPASSIETTGSINPPYDLHVIFTNAEDQFTD